MLDVALLRVFSEYLLMFQFVVCRTLDTYTHVTPDMQRAASDVVGGFLKNLLGEELNPWQGNEKAEPAP